MKNHSLSTKGLSLSQAQSISNLCNQACRDIDFKLSNINNATKELTLEGKTYVETQGHPIPTDLMELLSKKAALHATQAFLMENIKAKNDMLTSIEQRRFTYEIKAPEYPELEPDPTYVPVTAEWGWLQLTKAEYAEYLEAESFASHFGQFIHKGGKLDKLRTELPTMKTLEWMDVEKDKKTPLTVTIHHTIDQLGKTHEDLAAVHRVYEQKVNYYKAKVKNLVTAENARLAKENTNLVTEINGRNDALLSEYAVAREQYQAAKRKASSEFEEARQKETGEVSALRIAVDARFKDVIDFYLKQVQEK